jgi:hypothetical protein
MTTPALLPTSGGRKPQPPAAPYLAPGEQLVRVGASPTGHRGVWRGRRGWRAECGNGERAVITSEPPFLCAASGCFPESVRSPSGAGDAPVVPQAQASPAVLACAAGATSERKEGELPLSVQRANRELATVGLEGGRVRPARGALRVQAGARADNPAFSASREPKQEEAAQRR